MGRDVVLARAGRIGLGLLFAAVVWLRLSSLDCIPEHCADESYFGIQVAHLLAGEPFMIKTASANLLDPFFAALEVPVVWAFKPSLWVLRFPSALAGLLTVGLCYVLGRRALDRPTALIAAILAGTMPLAVVMSRWGFDLGLTPLFGLLMIMFALRANGPALVATYLASLANHPTNVFLGAVILPVYIARRLRQTSEDDRLAPRVRATLLTVGALGTTALIFAQQTLARHNAEQYYKKLHKPMDWSTYLSGYARAMFAFVWVPAESGISRAHVAAFWTVVGALLIVGTWRLARSRSWDRLALVGGWIVMLAAFHVMAGSAVFGETYRYATVLIVPTVMALACLIQATLTLPDSVPEAAGRLRLMGIVAVGGLLLVSVNLNWFGNYTRTGRESIWTFKADVKDMFVQALNAATRDHERNRARGLAKGPCLIVAEDWWRGRPLEFLAIKREDVQVVPLSKDWNEHAQDAEVHEMLVKMVHGAYAVCALDGTIEKTLKARVPAERLKRWVAVEHNGGPYIVVYRFNRDDEIAPPAVATSGTPPRR
jgi:4-amino-4-deoxy-L-arabinose transferase-like glycosyltransferase